MLLHHSLQNIAVYWNSNSNLFIGPFFLCSTIFISIKQVQDRRTCEVKYDNLLIIIFPRNKTWKSLCLLEILLKLWQLKKDIKVKKIQNLLTELLLSNVFVNFSAWTSSSLIVSSGVPWTCWPMNRAPGSSSIPWKEAMPSAS